MAICETCGNDYAKAFTVTIDDEQHIFDSFECAIQALAPSCSHCGTRIVGHGMEAGDRWFCCAHCAREGGIPQLEDNAAHAMAR